jgi:Abnormal spindle-like microcephaly-assoc'd, ASPM-SPD-2-Hydin
MLMRPHVGAMVLVLAGCLALCGCGAKAPARSSSSVAANLQFSNSTLAFGNVSVGSTKTSNLTIANASAAGGPSITLSQIKVTGAGFSIAPASTPPFTLDPGQTSTIGVTFAPKSAGAVNGDLSVLIEGSSTPESLTLSGNGLGASQLSASPSSMNFGNVAVGSSKSQNGSVTTGGSNITVSSAAWNGSGFSLSGITFPVTVPAGQSVPFTVTFVPQISGSATGQVSFVSDASNSPTVVTLAGSGTQATQHSVSLSWNASTSQVAGYNIYRGTSSGGPYTKLNSSLISGLSLADNSVQSGATYFYVATAVDSNDVESGHSNLATAVIP